VVDELCLPSIADGDTPWKVARWALMCAHLYYDRGVSVIDDADFDEMCRELIEVWDKIPEHERVLLGDPDELAHTGQGMAFSSLIVGQANQLALDLGETPGPYRFKKKYTCECCGCALAAVRG
jgi:hypothetical protein